MTQPSSEIWLVRHGETAWSLSGQHTSRTDLSLTEEGVERAVALKHVLGTHQFGSVFSSPFKRALDTARLSGLDPQVMNDLHEWDYGDYEGLTTLQIRETHPDWTIWTGDVPNGESIIAVASRADAVLRRLVEAPGPVAVFSHGHFLRVLAARWMGLDARDGRLLALGTGSVSVLGHERTTRVLRLWNQVA